MRPNTTMRAAFEAAKVQPGALPPVAKRVLRVMRRQDQRKPAAKRRAGSGK